MSEHPIEYSEALTIKKAMEKYLSGERDENKETAGGFDEDLKRILRAYEIQYIREGATDRGSQIHLLRLSMPTSQRLTVREAKVIMSRLNTMLSYIVPDYLEEKLERRIRLVERELGELGKWASNPTLEKKVTKLEEELRQLRVASVAITENSEKEQENMLKRYKSAKKKVFVIMPFAEVFDDVWNGGIKRACNSVDIGYLRVDKISLSSWITEDIVNYLEMADFVIADTTGNNPNVMFEFGWALALKKTPIVIRQKGDPNSLPFDVKDIRHISYQNNWSGIENLYSEICKFLRTTSETSEEKPAEENKKETKKRKK